MLPNRCILLGVKWPGCEVNYPPPPSAEVTNEWSYASTPLYVFVSDRENFTFTRTSNNLQVVIFIGTDVLTCLTEQCVQEIIWVYMGESDWKLEKAT